MTIDWLTMNWQYLTVSDKLCYWWCLLIVYLIFWKLWDWMLLLIVGPKASLSVVLVAVCCWFIGIQKIYWFCLSISCRFVVLATLFLEIRRIISLWRKLMQLNKCNLFGRPSTKWLHLSFSFCVNADWMFDILNAYSSRTAHHLQKGCKLARLKLFTLNS